MLMMTVLATLVGYWQFQQGPALVARQDNPRRVLAEQRIARGAIVDRNGHPLAVSANSDNGYVRYYPEPSAEPVVGYYSLQHGLGGIEATYDSVLRGTAGRSSWQQLMDGLLHRVPAGQSVRLTLDLNFQQAADAALGNQAGAIVILSVPDAEVLALVSHPTFNPTRLDDDWDRLSADPVSPLLNRATQGLYQPGEAFETVLLGEALARRWVTLTDTLPITDAPVAVNGAWLECVTPPDSNTWAAAFASACPAPFAAMADRFDEQSLSSLIQRWRLDKAPSPFELPVHASLFVSTSLTETNSVRKLVLGQGNLTVSPLQMAMVMGAVANGGQVLASPHLSFDSPRLPPPPAPLSAEATQLLRSAFPAQDSRGLFGQAAQAASGQGQMGWFMGFSSDWVIVVLVEKGNAVDAQQVAQRVSQVINR